MCGVVIGAVVLLVVGGPLYLLGVDPAVAAGVGAACGLFVAVWAERPNPKRKYVAEHGERLMAWLLPDWAYPIKDFYLVMVIFTFDKTVPDLPAFLERVMGRMLRTVVEARTGEEREVARLIRDVGSFELYTNRHRLPASLTEDREVYCIKTHAKKSLLPGGELSLPYIYIAALPDIPDVAADMVPYPDAAGGTTSKEPA